jgi:hypothetical protein
MTKATVEQSSRPATISNAVKLLYATLGIGALRAILEFQTLSQQIALSFFFSVVAFVVGVMWLLIHMIGSRRNWARITFLITFIVGVPFTVLSLSQSFSVSPVSGTAGILQIVGQVVALVMLFQTTSNAWFREPFVVGKAMIIAETALKNDPLVMESAGPSQISIPLTPPPLANQESTPPPLPKQASTPSPWYYAKEGKAEGPVPKKSLTEMLMNGSIGNETLVWTEGMENWRPIKEIEDSFQKGEERVESSQFLGKPAPHSDTDLEGILMINKPRRPWVAVLLTLLTMGLGHLYAGNPKRGFILYWYCGTSGCCLQHFHNCHSQCYFYAHHAYWRLCFCRIFCC